MKKTLNFIIAVCGLSVILFSCNSTPLKTTDVYILVDNTEKIASREGLIPTKSMLKLMNDGGSVTWQQINDVSLNANKTIEVSIPDDPTPVLRDDALIPFTKEFESMRKVFLGPVEKATDNSSIYKPLCMAMEHLQKSKGSQKILVIASDMIENSQFWNFYKEDLTFEQAKKQLDSSGFSIPEDTRIKIVILYHADNQKHEKQHDKMMQFWRKLF